MAIYLKKRRIVIEEWTRSAGTGEIIHGTLDPHDIPPEAAEVQRHRFDSRIALPATAGVAPSAQTGGDDDDDR